MCQLVREQFLPGGRRRRKLPCAKHDIAAHGVGQGIHGSGRVCCLGVGMHAYVTQVTAKPRLEKGARRLWQRCAATVQAFDLIFDSCPSNRRRS